MRPETFFVKYISVHNCFLHFSERWLEKFKDANNMVSFPDNHIVLFVITSREFAIAKRCCVRIVGLAIVLCSVKGNVRLL